jgi:hypothetical protein
MKGKLECAVGPGRLWSATKGARGFLVCHKTNCKRRRGEPGNLVKQVFSTTTASCQLLHLICYHTQDHANSYELLQPTSRQLASGFQQLSTTSGIDTGLTQKVFGCSICGKHFCGKDFGRNSNLGRHSRRSTLPAVFL